MTTLDRKLLREARASKGLILAITCLVAVGVMCYVYMQSAYSNLRTARDQYFAQCRLADFFEFFLDLIRRGDTPDGVGEVASFSGGRAYGDRVTHHDRAERLPRQILAKPPPVAYRAGQADRLGEVWLGHLGVVDGDATAGSQGPEQQGGVVDIPRDR